MFYFNFEKYILNSKNYYLNLTFKYELSQPCFEESVRITLALPEWELGSLSGLLKVQSLIAGVKTPPIVFLFISLENY
jgi:hypothetical protein